MSFWRFLKYERPYLYLCGACFLLTAAVFGINPNNAWDWESFYYCLALVLLLMTSFVLYRYLKNVQVIRKPDDEDAEPLSLEAEVCREEMRRLRISHIRSLNAIQDRQKETYDFIVSWFHEIKTPIAVMRLMQQTEMNPASLEEELSRIEHYVDQALYYAKLDSFNKDYEIVNCSLEQLAKAAVKHHSKTFISKKIAVRLEVDGTTVQSDSKWLLFILNQLVSNSLKYTADQGLIAITSRTTPQEKLLVIRDNGVGIDRKDLPRIFERGFTGTNGRTFVKSTGMGLYLAQELSKKLGHYITCDSAAGSFSEFTIHFPKNHDPYLSILRHNNEKTQ
ncbi:histidine kinase [Paenibacillus sp. FSL R7-0273]|uniref:sensor histidine kinase n=1 Tax=Paenibacillus sp. FSL R7-0273 TaxID=1536772 RepID=UPI0004F59066|nr:sensor histidine kinase [Paenibacillus sp. FSL R7-0273]AIQ48089.1 histidine kinase [Paenibacillus sp. FSL R7-0273]OMF85190.1 sensor histidine kinase [Paenibacillus sp. FSL R7-0273]